jgi:hypothetical protein
MIMKKILLLILLLPLFVNAQSRKDTLKWAKDTMVLAHLPIDSSGAISYKIIDNAPGISKDQLYDRAKIWSALAFNSAKNVTQLDDKNGGTIVIQALTEDSYEWKFFGSTYVIKYDLRFSIQITVKDSKYRLIMTTFRIETFPSQYTSAATYTLESRYKSLKEWNGNAKTGNMAFNRSLDLGKNAVRSSFQLINNLDSFAISTIEDAKKAMSKPAKADDF